MQFMLTPDFQKTLPTTNWMYPVIDMPLPPVYDKMPKPAKTLEFDAKKWRKSAISGYGYGKTQSAVNCRVPDTGRTRVRSSSGRCCQCLRGAVV